MTTKPPAQPPAFIPAREPPTEPFSYQGFLKWLGRKSHRAKLLRTPTPEVKSSREPFVRCANTLWPWRTQTYPGRYAMLAHVLGIQPQTAERYLKPGIRIPAKHKARLAAYMRAQSALLIEQAAQLDPPGRPPQK